MAGLERPWHIIILVLVLVVVFGAKRLPDSAKSVAKSLKIFKSELKEDKKDEGSKGSDESSSN